ncbi:MAG: hypothetical protein CFE24_12425 [Flavobacterium sp. BFFFF2]|nr:MAG: hypothetical protein CFE24_12425 [Flavobacterium sp. BFFFF2]
MTLEQIKTLLTSIDEVNFQLQDGTLVPSHFHVTEVGVISKHFIDCGGTIRNEQVANFQLWNAQDMDHRLKPAKLLQIIQLSEEKLGMKNLDIEVEYQISIDNWHTIGKYDLDFNGEHFVLLAKQTACLAADQCGIPTKKSKVQLAELVTSNSCKPGAGCC